MKTKSFKYRIYPTGKQKILLAQTFGCVRVIWNEMVAVFNSYDKETNPNPIFPTKKDLIESKPWLNEVSAAALQQKQRDFEETKKQLFSKTRKSSIQRPRFKKKEENQSYRLPNQKFKLVGDRVRLEKIGYVKVVVDRPIPGNSKLLSCTISKNCANQYFVSISFECKVQPKQKTGRTVGIDLGIKEFATLSDGIVIHNPKYLRESQFGIKRIQKHLSKKKKGSNRYRKNKLRLARLHNKVANRRKHFLHDITNFLINNYDVICIEDLNAEGMMKNHKLALSISDASFAEFRRILQYKCEWYGKELSVIDRFYPSSKTCSCCGWKKENLTLSDRTFRCESCGKTIDRDLNAAINIQRVGVDILYNRTQSSKVTRNGEVSKIK